MLDINLIRKNKAEMEQGLLKRVDSVNLGELISLDDQRRDIISKIDGLRSERNRLSKEIGHLKSTGGGALALSDRVSKIKDEYGELENELEQVSEKFSQLMLEIPNLPASYVPAGGKEANEVVKTWGDKPGIGPNAQDHVEISKRLGLVDYERGTKLGGSNFWIYTGLGAALEWALLNYFCKTHFDDGYTFLLPPHLLLRECGTAAGQFPKFHDDVFHISSESSDRGLFLLPTSETAILNVFRDEILQEEDLPRRMFAYTPCYRREPGGARAEERGTIRGHQFNKVELFQFCTEEQAEDSLQELVKKTESLVEALGLHYRTSLLAAKDASASMRVTYDVEVWIPSIGVYKEVSSASYAGDYQARRAKIRYRSGNKSKTKYVHTLNASGLATSRLLPAILEQNLQSDGSVRIPEPLQPWLGRSTL